MSYSWWMKAQKENALVIEKVLCTFHTVLSLRTPRHKLPFIRAEKMRNLKFEQKNLLQKCIVLFWGPSTSPINVRGKKDEHSCPLEKHVWPWPSMLGLPAARCTQQL